MKLLQLTLTAFFITIFFSSIYAQTITPRVGLTYAWTTSHLEDSEFTDYGIEMRQGFVVGVAYDFPISDNIVFQAEIDYVTKRHKSTSSAKAIYFGSSQDYALSFLEVPLLVKIPLARQRLFPHFGINIAYGLSGSVQYNIYDTKYPSSDKMDVKFKEINPSLRREGMYIGGPFDFGAEIGVGVLVHKRFMIDARYAFGLSEFRYLDYSQGKDRNQVLQVSVGFPIKMKTKENN